MPPGSRRIVMTYLWPPILLFVPMTLCHAARSPPSTPLNSIAPGGPNSLSWPRGDMHGREWREPTPAGARSRRGASATGRAGAGGGRARARAQAPARPPGAPPPARREQPRPGVQPRPRGESPLREPGLRDGARLCAGPRRGPEPQRISRPVGAPILRWLSGAHPREGGGPRPAPPGEPRRRGTALGVSQHALPPSRPRALRDRPRGGHHGARPPGVAAAGQRGALSHRDRWSRGRGALQERGRRRLGLEPERPANSRIRARAPGRRRRQGRWLPVRARGAARRARPPQRAAVAARGHGNLARGGRAHLDLGAGPSADPLERKHALRRGHVVRGRHRAATPPDAERHSIDLLVLQEDPRRGWRLAAGGDLRPRPFRGRLQPRRLLGMHAASAPGIPPEEVAAPAVLARSPAPASPASRYRCGSARKSGIFRVVLFWYSAYGGNAATAISQSRARSASFSTSRTRIAWSAAWSRISTAGFARRLCTQTGCVGSPPCDPTRT